MDWSSFFASLMPDGSSGYNPSDAPGVIPIPRPTQAGRTVPVPSDYSDVGQPIGATPYQNAQGASTLPQTGGILAPDGARAARQGAPDLFGPPQSAMGQSPVAAAMAPPAPPPATPVSNAMDTSGDQGGALYGSSDSGAPAAPSLSPFQQLLQQRANDPNKALWDSLGSAGAAILGGKDLKEGLAAGGDAFNKQYDKTFKEQQEQNTPKVTPMADGAFSLVQLPGQPPQVVPNEKVAEFLRQKQILATEAGTQKALTVMNARATAQQNQQNRKYGQESAPLALQFQQQDTDIDNARKLEAGGPNAPQLAAALFPKLAGATDAPQVALQQLRARIAATNISLQTSMQKGATTDKERATIAQDVPDVTAGPEIWREFYDRTQPLVKKNYQYHQDRVNAAYEAGATGLQGQYKPAQQQPAQGTPAQPAVSGGGVQSVTSKAAYDALPSGTTYKGPDGKLRTKQ